MKGPASAEIRLALLICMVVAVVDFTVRVFPEGASDDISKVPVEPRSFGRLVPSEAWIAWHESIKVAAEAEAKRVEEERLALAQAESSTKPDREVSQKDDQKGDLLRVKIGGITYQLWGVFNKVDKVAGKDTFGVLKSKNKSIQIRIGDVIGSYRVTAIETRSVTFASTVDERVATLWLFGKGPR